MTVCSFSRLDDEQRIEAQTLIAIGKDAEALPQSRRDAVAHASYEPHECRNAGEQHLALNQASGGEIEQDGRPRGAAPGARVEPSGEAEKSSPANSLYP